MLWRREKRTGYDANGSATGTATELQCERLLLHGFAHGHSRHMRL
jgi:hypothetical protein